MIRLRVRRRGCRALTRLVQRRAEAEAVRARGQERPHVVRRDSADRHERHLRRDHRAPCLHDMRAELFGGEHLQHVRAVLQREERFVRRRDARRAGKALRFRGAHDIAVAMRHHDQLAAGRLHFVDEIRMQHRARADDRVGRQRLADRRDAVERLRRIQRHFDDPKARFVQRAAVVGGVGRRHAAQDRDQRTQAERGSRPACGA